MKKKEALHFPSSFYYLTSISLVPYFLQTISRDTGSWHYKGTENNYLKTNRIPRYHYLQFKDNLLPALVIDFKHYFSVNALYLKKLKESNFIGKIPVIFREQISQRYAYFLSRIRLPIDDTNNLIKTGLINK